MTTNSRPTDWGQREKHPLYQTWCWLRRTRFRSQLPTIWDLNFWQFVKDVGNRPSAEHRLRKPDKTRPIGPNNFEWKETIALSKDRAAYARAWRKANPERAKDADLKKHFGISIEQYKEMLERQGGVCAICEQPETSPRFNYLAVDHDHQTGKIRGLLCWVCNVSLGKFQHKVGLLKAAVRYLERT